MARTRRRRRRSDPTPGWLWMTGGFALGLVVALGVYVGRHSLPDIVPARTLADAPRAAAAPADATEPATPVPGSTVASRTRAAPDTDPDDERRFEFYELLPEFEVIVPEVESRADLGPAPADVTEPGRYVLQVGSFTSLADADRMRANLALLGIESRLQRVAIDDQVFHRVRIGPLDSLREINRLRNRLREERIDSLPMRVTDE